MKVTKKLLAILMSMLLCIMAAPLGAVTVSAETETTTGTYGNLTYEITDGQVTITDCNYTAIEVEIPKFIEVNGVEYSDFLINTTAFTGCSELKSIIVDEENINFSSLNGILFDKYQMKIIRYPEGKTSPSYAIPETVKYIGDYAFVNCGNLEFVTIPNYVETIGNGAFLGCESLQNATLPDTVTNIGDYAFSKCNGLYSMLIPDSVETIGKYAFSECLSLTEITIGKSVTSLGFLAFFNCHSLISITVDADNAVYSDIDGVLFNVAESELVQYPLGKSNSSYTVPDQVKTIGNQSFVNCTNLTKIEISDSVVRIGFSAFSGCTYLKSVKNSNSLESIGSSAFYNCLFLENINISDTLTSIENSVFYGCISLDEITIPSSVTDIGKNVFYNCFNLTIYGYTNSTAEAYATENDIPFIALDENLSLGDLDGDGLIGITDLVFFEKYILSCQILSANQAASADLNGDGKINAFDVIMMKKALLN